MVSGASSRGACVSKSCDGHSGRAVVVMGSCTSSGSTVDSDNLIPTSRTRSSTLPYGEA